MSDIVTMLGNINLSDDIAQIPDKGSPLMNLPYELRRKIWGFAAIKPDGYIGQADDNGVTCGVGVEVARSGEISLNDEYHHFPHGCRHPAHEWTTILQDYRDYRCSNLALICRQTNVEVSEVFFRKNGFEFRDAHNLICFFSMIGLHNNQLVQKVRLHHNITINKDNFPTIFGATGIGCKTLYLIFEQEYLGQDESTSALVSVLKSLKSWDKIKDFQLVYRLNIPGSCFNVARSADTGILLDIEHYWRGENMQWEIRTKNVLEKLRQGKNGSTTSPIAVELDFFTANALADAVATTFGRRHRYFVLYADVLIDACLAHAEDCIEETAAGQDRIMDAALI
jgi:hypothetical protein